MSRRARYSVMAIAAAAGVLAFGVLWNRDLFGVSLSYTTGIGQHRTVRLRDGTQVTLNTNSRIVVRLNRRARTVELVSGEALFHVAHEGRPFSVQTADAVIEDIGTRFDVRREPQSLDVTVIEGQVRVRAADARPATLSAGQAMTLSSASSGLRLASTRSVSADALTRKVSWTTGRLLFEGERLADIVAEFNRYNTRRLQIADPKLAEIRFGGGYAATDPDGFARALDRVFGIEYSVSDDSKTIRLRAGRAAAATPVKMK